MIRLKRLFAHDFKQLHEIDLPFPEAGRILVQGKNEAGKSTLFEAVFFALFGQALATESSGRPNLEDLIGYEKNKARVELDLAVGERLFRIIRTLNRGKPNVWELEITKGDQIEEIKGNRAVNDRLVSELGFDAEALLNTCFVEQKKLEKLEGLNKSKREESLSKLLNLERLLDLEEKLRLRAEDEKLLSRLGKRVELAEAQQQLPTAEEDLLRSEAQLKLVELHSKLTSALDEKRAAKELRAQLQTMQSRREGLREAAKSVDALDEARRATSNALDRFDLLAQQTVSLQEMQHERDDTERAAREHMPALEQRVRDLSRLARGYERLYQIEAARTLAVDNLQRLDALRAELAADETRSAGLESQLKGHEARAAEIDILRRNYDIGEALGAWAGAAREAAEQDSGGQALAASKRARELLGARQVAWLRISGMIVFALIAATGLVPTLLYLLTRSVVLAVVVAGGLLAFDAVLIAVLVRRAILLSNELQESAAEQAKVEGESLNRGVLASAKRERLNRAEARLRELGFPTPTSLEAAESRRIEIAATLENKTLDELNAERDAVRERLNYVRAQRDEILQRVEGLRGLVNGDSQAHSRIKVERATQILSHRVAFFARQAEGLQVRQELQAIRDARQEAESQRRAWQARIQQMEKTAGQIREGEKRASKIADELRTSYERATALLDGQAPSWSPELSRGAYQDLGRSLSEAFESQGGEQVRGQLNSLEKELGACERELRIRDKAGQDALAQALSILKELGSVDTINRNSSIEELEELASRVQKVKLDRSELEARVRSLHLRVGGLRETRDRLERELGLQGEAIELDAARESLANEREQQEERKYGDEIVSRARKRIVQKVLPATMDYMRRILPQLTRDRYHDAELDPETYKIRVWDERAGQNGAWKEKNIFSGGTKDQFSLALRLAFALATLPQERGTSPGFIFLDEPLGSFDDERAAALLYLLTEGEIAHAFDQIFLISHVRVQEDRFTHQIRLENGAVVETSLPSNGN